MTKYICLFALVLLFSNTYGQSIETPIVPKPQSVKFLQEKFLVKENIKINIVGSKNDELDFTAGLISQTLNDFLKTNSSTKKSDAPSKGVNLIIDGKFNVPTAKNNDDAYSLVIKKNEINIVAATARGVFDGAMSLIQLLEKSKDNELAGLEIIDYPDLKVRGISDDISRGQVPTIDNFKKIIRHISRYKMNVYMPYLEDMVQFDVYPTIGVNRGALTKAEIKELVAYAKNYFVEIIPVFQTLGHYENILSQEEFIKYAEFKGAASLNVSSDSTYVFLENMLKEVFELFPSEYFNMGADESYDVGRGRSKYLVDQSNIAKVHAAHYQKVYDICKKYNKKVMMYGDIILSHPEILELLPKDITIVDWHYQPEADFPSTKTFKKYGFNYYVSPASWNYLTTFPTNQNALPNIKSIIKSGLKNGATGAINSNWGDYGSETIKEFILFDYAWSAQCAWNFEGSDAGNFAQNYFYDFFGIDDGRIPQLYESFANPLNQAMWHSIWRHPLLPFRAPMYWENQMAATGRISWIEYTMPGISKNIEQVEPLVKKNKDHFELLKFLVKLDLWYKTKLETQLALQYKMYGYDLANDQLPALIDKNISDLKSLKNEYKTLWLKYYKQDNLNLIENKFDRLIAYFDEIKGQVNRNEHLVKPLISSKWIYSPVKNDTTVTATQATFKKEFELDEAPSSAMLQLLGDTHARLTINGKFVDEVFVRKSLSLVTEYKRIKFIDVARYLVKGANTIEVEVETFNSNGSAGFNLISEIKCGDKITNLISDNSWQTKNSVTDWENAFVKAYPFEVISPDFSTKRTSWIER
jgi:hexosaminidase